MFNVAVHDIEYKVDFYHVKGCDGAMRTRCNIHSPDDSTLDYGETRCSLKDMFDRNKGRKIAMMRALQGFPKADRKPFWDVYFVTRGGKY